MVMRHGKEHYLMSILNTSNNSEQVKYSVDKMFSEYIDYIATKSIDNIENCMKRNLGDRRSFNNQNYERILWPEPRKLRQ